MPRALEIYEQLKDRASVYNPYRTETFLCSIALFTVAVCLGAIAIFQNAELNNTHCQSVVVSETEYLSGTVRFSNALQFRFAYDMPDDLVSVRYIGKLPADNSVATICGGDSSCEDIETITCADAGLPPACGIISGRLSKLDSGDVPLKSGGGIAHTTRQIRHETGSFLFVVETTGNTYTTAVGPMCAEP